MRASIAALVLVAACSETPTFFDATIGDRGFEDTGFADAVSIDRGFEEAGPIDAGLPYVPGDPPEGDASFVITDGVDIMLQGIELPWWAGPQGGHHVYAASRASAALLDPLSDQERRALTVIFELRRDRDGVLLAETRRTGGFVMNAGAWASPTVLVILMDGFDVQQTASELLRLSATVRLSGGRQLSSRVYVITRCCN